MHERVDLTENRDFRKEGGILSSLLISNLRRFPWIDAESWYSTNEACFLNELILTGDKKTRSKKRFEVQIHNNEMCEKCGKYLKLWDGYRGLCYDCDKEESELIVPIGSYPMTEVFIRRPTQHNNWITIETERELEELFL